MLLDPLSRLNNPALAMEAGALLNFDLHPPQHLLPQLLRPIVSISLILALPSQDHALKVASIEHKCKTCPGRIRAVSRAETEGVGRARRNAHVQAVVAPRNITSGPSIFKHPTSKALDNQHP